jgi:Predicted transcriptional regulators
MSVRGIKMRRDNIKSGRGRVKPVHGQVLTVAINDVAPSLENTLLYRPVKPDDEATIALADSIRKNGVLEPIVISADRYIISGHRRHIAAGIAGLKKVPCRIIAIRRGGGEQATDEFVQLLREHNRHRVKNRDELLREAIADVDPDDAHQALTAYRQRKAAIDAAVPIQFRETGRRCSISSAKMEFLEAVKKIIVENKKFLPLSLRQIHYQLLNEPPLVHSRKHHSRYRNNSVSYRALIDLVTRARHQGYIAHQAIDDPTRPTTSWEVFQSVAHYYEFEIADLLNGYWRDLMQSQTNHFEIVAEKNTLQSVLRPIAQKFCIPLTIGRGQCSTRPLYDIAKRFERSGKMNLIILAVSDLDPDGDAIAHSIGQRLRDDYDISEVAVIKAALTMKQVAELELPKKYERAKRGSPNYKRYVNAYDTDCVWELEALDPTVLQNLLTVAIESVIDLDAYNAEVDAEREDAAHIAATRARVLSVLREHLPEEAA